MLSDRIKQVRTALDLTQEEFAKKMYATRPMIASYEINKVQPPEHILKKMCSTYNINKDWLETGKGEIFNPLSEDEQIAKLISEINIQQHPELKETITEISKLNVDQIKLLLALAKEINKGNKN